MSPSPGQYAMPRFDGTALSGSSNRHLSLPVVASSAMTAPYGEAEIHRGANHEGNGLVFPQGDRNSRSA